MVRLTSGPLYPLWNAHPVPKEHEPGCAPDMSWLNHGYNVTEFLKTDVNNMKLEIPYLTILIHCHQEYKNSSRNSM